MLAIAKYCPRGFPGAVLSTLTVSLCSRGVPVLDTLYTLTCWPQLLHSQRIKEKHIHPEVLTWNSLTKN